jgi:cell division protein FtsL
MSAIAPAPARAAASAAAAAPTAAPARTRPVRVRRLSTSGLIWMGVLTLLLGGLVALNVAALRSTIAVSDVNAKVRKLEQQNRLQMADIANLSTSARIARKAQSYGMHQSSPKAKDFFSLKLPTPKHASVPAKPAGGNPG